MLIFLVLGMRDTKGAVVSQTTTPTVVNFFVKVVPLTLKVLYFGAHNVQWILVRGCLVPLPEVTSASAKEKWSAVLPALTTHRYLECKLHV